MTDPPFPPGSTNAVAEGCTCPVWDNPYLEPDGEDALYYIDFDCPLHGENEV